MVNGSALKEQSRKQLLLIVTNEELLKNRQYCVEKTTTMSVCIRRSSAKLGKHHGHPEMSLHLERLSITQKGCNLLSCQKL